MNDVIKVKLNELFLACLDNGFHFSYGAHVNALTVMPIGFDVPEDFILLSYSLGFASVGDDLEQLELAIKKVKGE